MSGNLDREDPNRGEQERAMRLMEALSGVDERLLERCGSRAGIHRKPLWMTTRAVAAVLCLAVVGAVSWGGYRLSNMRMGSAGLSGGDAGGFEEGNTNNAAPQDAVSGDTAERPDEQENLPAGRDDQRKEMDQAQQTSSGQTAGGAAVDKSESGKEAAGNGAEASPEAAEEEGADRQENGSVKGGEDGATEFEGCLPLQSVKLTEAQARAEAGLGAYVPALLPEGYVFEDAYYVPGDSEANLTVCWSRGMDSIMLHLKKPANLPKTVDVDMPERYDESLYEIPYGETVPEEYREEFDNPVFAAEDFSLAIVKSRMKVYEDQGDTDTPRGNFGVLYPDGVLVRFSGRGTAEEIWEMFCSMSGSQ